MHGKQRQNEGLLGKEASLKVTEEEKPERSFQKSGKGWALGRGGACFNFAHGYHTFNCTVKKKVLWLMVSNAEEGPVGEERRVSFGPGDWRSLARTMSEEPGCLVGGQSETERDGDGGRAI